MHGRASSKVERLFREEDYEEWGMANQLEFGVIIGSQWNKSQWLFHQIYATVSNFIDQESRTWSKDILENSLLDFEASTTKKNPTV